MGTSMRWMLLASLLATGCAQKIVVNDDLDGSIGPPRDGGAIDAGVVDSGVPYDGGDHDPNRDGGPRDGGSVRDGGTEACFVGPFDPCDDPDEAMNTNNEWSSASAIHTTSAGCQTGDDFVPLDASASSVLCNVEPADFYRLTIVPCDTRTMIATLRLTIHDTCPADRYNLAWFSGGGRLDCDDPQDGLMCSVENGELVMRRRVNPGNSVFSWQFAVESDFEDVRFDYTLRITLE